MPRRIYIVEASKEDEVQYWAAATLPENATRAVLDHLGQDWSAKLTDRQLSSEYAALLEVPPGRVRRIRYANWN
jgi:hypothetical protein